MLEKPNLKSIVELAAVENGEDSQAAISQIVKAVRARPDLRTELLELGADQALRNHYTRSRAAPPREPISDEEAEERVAAREYRRQFWDRYTLFGHKPLVDATADDLRESAQKRRAMAAGNIRRARYEEALAKEMGTSTKRVGAVLKLSLVEKLAEKHNASS